MGRKILYVDLETTKKGKIKDVGALFKGNELHEKSLTKLENWIDEAKYICGHNIINHDIPILEKYLGKDIFKGKVFIDTLLWSPLLFAERPYHSLVKGYKIVNENDYSNPLSDCKLTKELFQNEIDEFDSLDQEIKDLYFFLLKNDSRYSGFFELYKYSSNNKFSEDNAHAIFKDKICSSSNLKSIIEQTPVALAYALALINTKDEDSVCSTWVIHQEPQTQVILENIRFKNCNDSDCNYCSKKLNPKKALQDYFGYEDFRSFDYDEEVSLQERTVRAGLQNQSFVAVFPTGGGKSLTFQLPALMKGALARQLTVVISPLVSLMKDQVDVLEDRFGIVKAVAINGLLSPLERSDAFEQVRDGRAHILYISPESLRSPSITRLLKDRTIARFVIDEAHCFSSWGQDFRVDYLFIGEFIKQLKKAKAGNFDIPVSCFTATAKPQVIEDIKTYFSERLDLNLSEYITRAERENLQYEVIDVESSENKIKELIPLLEICDKPCIVYSSRTKKVEELAEIIKEAGISVTSFHGKMEKEVKVKNQNSFMKGEVDIIVATSAFGMGVDKDDVRTVIHYDISDSLENYTQEAGRAGRKKDIQAKCYILFHEDDLNKHFSLVQQTKINLKEIQEIWKAIKYMTKFRENISNSALEIAKRAGWDTEIRELANKVTTSLAALEDQGFLKRKQNSPRVFADSLIIRNIDKALKVVQETNKLTNDQKNLCSRLLQRLIKEDECRLDYLADILDLTIKQVQEGIMLLRDLELLGDKKDLTAFLNVKESKNGSRQIINRFIALEKELLKIILTDRLKFSMRQLNQKMLDNGVTSSSTESIRSLLDYWDRRNFISKRRVDRQNELYELQFNNRSFLENEIEIRHEIAAGCFQGLERKYKEQIEKYTRKEDVPVQFSLLELKTEVDRFLSQSDTDIKKYNHALLFLHHVKAIKLEGGFMVIYNKLNISEVDRTKTRFTLKDYQKLKKHYEHKIQQIHIVGEYAKKQIKNYTEALTYVNEYFTLPFEEFKEKYFPRRGREISRAMTDSKFAELMDDLSTDQVKIVNSKDENMLVLAGPGSGKTRVLVHKIASLLLLEDIKPEQFLMLTFSKAAALEFRSRIYKLIPEFGRLIKIATFHGYCFKQLGQLGDLEKSEHVIQDCIEAIRNEDIDISSITNKSVLLLDEFQDVDENEWELIKVIKEKAGNIRIIAVGDDDQNIYEFRGSSIAHMKEFIEIYDSKTYSLVKNYRSREGIIKFNNRLLQSISNRLKKDEVLLAPKKTNKAKLKIVQYGAKHFFEPLVEDVISSNYQGTTALLTRTNMEALLVTTLLKGKGVKVRLIAGMDGFNLNDLFEMRRFQDFLEERANEVGIIFKSNWETAKQKFSEKYSQSPNFETCLEVIRLFEKEYNSVIEMAEWKDYIRQIKTEDAVHLDKETIIVSTMHKSKGKEFDNVYIMMRDYEIITDYQKRLIYVACSRAKKSLSIHLNSSFFRSYEIEGLKYITYEKQVAPPVHFDLVLNHKDVNLGSQKFYKAKNVIDSLKSGDVLLKNVVKFDDNDALGLAKPNLGNMLLFSRNFLDGKYKKIISAGYIFEKASVEYIVYWYDHEEDMEYKIILPRLYFVIESQIQEKNE